MPRLDINLSRDIIVIMLLSSLSVDFNLSQFILVLSYNLANVFIKIVFLDKIVYCNTGFLILSWAVYVILDEHIFTSLNIRFIWHFDAPKYPTFQELFVYEDDIEVNTLLDRFKQRLGL